MRSLALRLKNDSHLTPAEIAAAVEPSGAERRAAKRLDELRRRRDELRAEAIAVRADMDGFSRSGAERRIAGIYAELDKVEREITEVRSQWSAARSPRAVALSAALAAIRECEAQRALQAIAELREAWSTLHACAKEERRAGGEPLELISLRDLLSRPERQAKRLLGQ